MSYHCSITVIFTSNCIQPQCHSYSVISFYKGQDITNAYLLVQLILIKDIFLTQSKVSHKLFHKKTLVYIYIQTDHLTKQSVSYISGNYGVCKDLANKVTQHQQVLITIINKPWHYIGLLSFSFSLPSLLFACCTTMSYSSNKLDVNTLQQCFDKSSAFY